MNPTTDAERALIFIATHATSFIFSMKKSGLCPILPVNDECVYRRILCLLSLIADRIIYGDLYGKPPAYDEKVYVHVQSCLSLLSNGNIPNINYAELPDDISEGFMRGVERYVFGVILSANSMLPSSLQRSPCV